MGSCVAEYSAFSDAEFGISFDTDDLAFFPAHGAVDKGKTFTKSVYAPTANAICVVVMVALGN